MSASGKCTPLPSEVGWSQLKNGTMCRFFIFDKPWSKEQNDIRFAHYMKGSRMIHHKCLSEEDRAILIGFFDNYRAPFCFIYAIACARGTGFQPVILTSKYGSILHAGVRDTEGYYRDVRGKLTESSFVVGLTFEEDFVIRDTTEEEMFKILREVNHESMEDIEERVRRARVHAESLWPEWEWKESHLQQLKAFTEELSNLCRKYGVWIREPYPAASPILYKTTDVGEQFELEQLASPNCQYLLRRTFK